MPGASETILCGAEFIWTRRPISSVTMRASAILTQRRINTKVRHHVKLFCLGEEYLKLNGYAPFESDPRHRIVEIGHRIPFIINTE